jgi:hypothetical protein
MSAAVSEQLRMHGALGEPPHGVAPLRRSLDVPHPLASEDQKAPRAPALGGRPQLAGDRGERNLIEVAHPVCDVPDVDRTQASYRASHQLQVAVPAPPTEFDRASARRAVTLAVEAQHLARAEADPPSLAGVLVTFEHALRPLEPRPGDRAVAA